MSLLVFRGGDFRLLIFRRNALTVLVGVKLHWRTSPLKVWAIMESRAGIVGAPQGLKHSPR